MKNKTEKTNVMRLLDQQEVSYIPHSYDNSQAYSGVEVANMIGEDINKVFKTLVTQGASKQYYVFVIPVAGSLNLKKAATAAHEKSIVMIPQKELLPLTGYVHGGCSPIGMKKPFPTFIDETAVLNDTIIFSAGKIGYQVETGLEELKKVLDYQLADVCD